MFPPDQPERERGRNGGSVNVGGTKEGRHSVNGQTVDLSDRLFTAFPFFVASEGDKCRDARATGCCKNKHRFTSPRIAFAAAAMFPQVFRLIHRSSGMCCWFSAGAANGQT